MDIEKNQRLVERLIYHSHIRPDITYAVSMVSQYMHDPYETLLHAILWILQYLKLTSGKYLLFSKNGHFKIEIFIDADWAGSLDDRRSTTSYCTLVGCNLVTWKKKELECSCSF